MSGEKTEEPTHKKLSDLRKKGKVPKSKDAAVTISVVSVICFILSTAGAFMGMVSELFTSTLTCIQNSDGPMTTKVYIMAGEALAWGIFPICGVVIVSGVVAYTMQTGILISFEALKPEGGKLNIFQNLKQMFSGEAFFELGTSIAKVGVLGVIFYVVFKGMVPVLITALYSGKVALIPLLQVLFKKTLTWFSLAFVLLSGADYMFRRYRFTKQNMMSKDEVKREYKESEGDPHIKAKRKQLAEEAVEAAILEKTRTATVLVVNPTHYAVALFYDENAPNTLPMVVGKGVDRLATRMMKVAQEEGVPIMRDVALARGLFADSVVDHPIPVTFIKPVAETLKWAKRFKKGQA